MVCRILSGGNWFLSKSKTYDLVKLYSKTIPFLIPQRFGLLMESVSSLVEYKSIFKIW